MDKLNISIIRISQLKDNYSYLIKDHKSKNAVIIDPAESEKIIKILTDEKMNLTAILLTHHHTDHVAGVSALLKFKIVPVYSPSNKIKETTHIVEDNSVIDLSFIKMSVISTPGHTLDHVVYYNKHNKLLFSGDTLFRLGCGRVFEGTFDSMHQSLQKINTLEDETIVYCGHEYTKNNLNFLESIFSNNFQLQIAKDKINKQLKLTNSSVPFNLGSEKQINPFLSSNNEFYQKFKNTKKFTDLQMFCFLRELKDKF
ncbi:hydroxyacylglutathione hydrolase [Alphaproteobacteria bacterium]|nr:hydroxyacylglutathione hydrolase [Alphaproteobacteria bacterium]